VTGIAEWRAEILTIHLQKRGREAQAFDVARVAAETAEFTGSEMEKVVQAGLRRAFARGEELTTEHLVEVARTMVSLATTMSAGIAQMREWAARARLASSRQQTGQKEESGGRALMM
jgi:SpoVK/Ycf46/Vps4 family AAA+-type ATPase